MTTLKVTIDDVKPLRDVAMRTKDPVDVLISNSAVIVGLLQSLNAHDKEIVNKTLRKQKNVYHEMIDGLGGIANAVGAIIEADRVGLDMDDFEVIE